MWEHPALCGWYHVWAGGPRGHKETGYTSPEDKSESDVPPEPLLQLWPPVLASTSFDDGLPC